MSQHAVRRGIFYARGDAVDLLAILIADHASFDEHKKLNIMGVFNEIRVQEFPALHPLMMIVTRLSASLAEADSVRKVTVKILDEDGKTQLLDYTRDVEVKTPSGPGRRFGIDGILRINNIVFQKPGTYQVSVLIDSDEKGSVPLYVVQAEP